ncbi:MAG: SDR family NAD(P)-dependent oxidoreductase [Alphaproteobacteria bacterium]|nr:SDR family NAD(P)-dependent oxidoreductase [Alphaproteobacteria bacterium]
MVVKKSIAITGAGSGIGAATAKRFARAGWFVGMFDINMEALEATAAAIDGESFSGHMDVTAAASVAGGLKDFTAKTGGQLDVMCANAGLFEDKPVAQSAYDTLNPMIQVNVNGVIHCAKEAYPYLKATTGATLVNLGSAASIYGVPMEATYAATKFFVRGLSEALAVEWRHDDIALRLIMPSYVRTPMLDQGPVSWADNATVHLSAGDIADTIWAAVHGRGLYWITPFNVRMLQTILRKIPLQLTPWLARRIFRKTS